jgi:methyl-accepting chemotaxis protein
MKLFENVTLQIKLILLTGVLVVAMGVLTWVGFQATTEWKVSMHNISENTLPSLESLSEIRNGIIDIVNQENKIRGLKSDTQIQSKALDASRIIANSFKKIKEGIKIYKSIEKSTQESKDFKEFNRLDIVWISATQQAKTNIIDHMANINDPAQKDILFMQLDSSLKSIQQTTDKLIGLIDAMYKANKDHVSLLSQQEQKKSDNYKQKFIITSFIAILIAIIFSWWLIKSISGSVIQSVFSIRDGSMQITSASDQVAASSTSLAQGASEQASSVEEVSATLEESTAINTQNTDNARQADILAKNANDAAKEGYKKGEELSQSMHSITESATKISGIIKTIDQIAFQTNLLALNAAVEAARAGEHGLGFAVVADEVRNLAQRAASAAKETSEIIEEVVEQIKEGNDIALATHTAFQDIVEQSKKVSDIIGEISIAGKEQSEGMIQINQAMGQVDQVTQQVAANSEETAAAAEELNSQANSMMDVIKVLARMVGMEEDRTSGKSLKIKHLYHENVSEKNKTKPTQKNPKKTDEQKEDSLQENKSAEEVFPLKEEDLKEF